jgi:hypothetical protein
MFSRIREGCNSQSDNRNVGGKYYLKDLHSSDFNYKKDELSSLISKKDIHILNNNYVVFSDSIKANYKKYENDPLLSKYDDLIVYGGNKDNNSYDNSISKNSYNKVKIVTATILGAGAGTLISYPLLTFATMKSMSILITSTSILTGGLFGYTFSGGANSNNSKKIETDIDTNIDTDIKTDVNNNINNNDAN